MCDLHIISAHGPQPSKSELYKACMRTVAQGTRAKDTSRCRSKLTATKSYPDYPASWLISDEELARQTRKVGRASRQARLESADFMLLVRVLEARRLQVSASSCLPLRCDVSSTEAASQTRAIIRVNSKQLHDYISIQAVFRTSHCFSGPSSTS